MDKKLLRFAAAVLAAILLFSFSACKIKDGDSDSSTEEPSVTVDSGAVTVDKTGRREHNGRADYRRFKTLGADRLLRHDKARDDKCSQRAQLHQYL